MGLNIVLQTLKRHKDLSNMYNADGEISEIIMTILVLLILYRLVVEARSNLKYNRCKAPKYVNPGIYNHFEIPIWCPTFLELWPILDWVTSCPWLQSGHTSVQGRCSPSSSLLFTAVIPQLAVTPRLCTSNNCTFVSNTDLQLVCGYCQTCWRYEYRETT
jgi:hypothetical protein